MVKTIKANDASRIASLDSLISEGLGGRAMLDIPGELKSAVASLYLKRLQALDQYDFWREGEDQYRPERGLRLPQRRAVAFVQAYLATREQPTESTKAEAALIKMPTGTGKTAVIAALACAGLGPCKTLVLTPRKALVRQMALDLSTRFWCKLGAAYTEDGLQENLAEAELTELDKTLRGNKSPVRILTSDHYNAIWNSRDADRQIWVGTFNALHRILAIKPPPHRDFYGREAQAAASSLSELELEPEDAGDPTKHFKDLLRSADLVIVDEGHHEPAYSWSQAVRTLNKPTVVFSATPYRNDYKYFQLSGRFVFNLSWQESVDNQLIRDAVCKPPVGLKKPNADTYDAEAFAAEFEKTLKALPAGKKAIAHAATFGALKAMQRAFFKKFKEKAVLIHDRVVGMEKEQPADLRKQSREMREALQPLRFGEVYLAAADNNAKTSRLWLHQYKLLEGIDDASFIEIWLYDNFGTARQLIQQIGRAIRRPDLSDRHGATAIIRGSQKPVDVYEGASTVHDIVQKRWTAYLSYEKYAQSSPAQAFTSETQLLPLLKRSSPEVQYVAGEFRGAHFLDETPSMEAFVLPRRATVCRVITDEDASTQPITDDFLDDLRAKAIEAMQLEERFDIKSVGSASHISTLRDVRMVSYLKWRNSPLLKSHQIPEWTLGVWVAVRAGEFILMIDTEGNCIDYSGVGLAAPDPIELKRLFAEAKTGTPSRVRIVETTARGLDVSELGLRSISVRRHALNAGYFDLAETSQTPISVEGYSPLGNRTSRRRLSLARASVADASHQFVSVKDYADWSKQLGNLMADKKLKPHSYFDRFAKEVQPLHEAAGMPRSILLDVNDLIPEPGSLQDHGWDRPGLERLLEADTCLEISEETDENGDHVKYWFAFDGHPVEIKYVYRATIPPYGRYQLQSEALNSSVTEGHPGDNDANEVGAALETNAFGRQLSPSLTRLINGQQAFQIITNEDGVIYSHGHFYKPDLDASLLEMIEGDASVATAISEKGDTRVKAIREWSSKTLFGLVDTWSRSSRTDLSDRSLAADISQCDTLICDDSTAETADFYGLDQASRRVFVIHAKAKDVGKPKGSARNLQEVARQALTSLALAGSARQAFPFPTPWQTDWEVTLKDAQNKKVRKPRIWKSSGLTIKEAHKTLCDALANPLFRTEIIVLTSGLVSLSQANAAFQNKSLPNLQFLYYLATLRSTFERAGVQLRIVGNP